MKSSKNQQKKFLKKVLIITTLPQILLLTMILFKPIGSIALETDNLKITGFLFVIYYVVFSIIIGIKSKKYSNRIITSIAQFFLLNFYQGILFMIVLKLFEVFSFFRDAMGLSIIVLAYFALVIISILIFSITCFFTNFIIKKKNIIDENSEKREW